MTIILFFEKEKLILFFSGNNASGFLKNSQSNDLSFKSDFIFGSFSNLNAFIVGLNFRQKV
jgi:hypothetical protein